MPKITEVFVLILIACFVSLVLELNKFGTNLEKGIKRPNIIYISSALTSVLCGILAALTGILFSKNILMWVILDILGTFMGTKSLTIILKILCLNINFLKSSNILEDTLKSLDEKDDSTDKEIINKHQTTGNQ